MALRPIYYDTETTGLKPGKDRVIELAAYDPGEDRTFCSLIHPGGPIPPEASSISGITDEMVKDAPSFQEVGAAFVSFCEGDVVLVAHNNDQFDQLFLESEYQRSNLVMPKWSYFDTLKWARKYRPDLPKHTLQFLRETFGIEANRAHRALDDVLVLHKVTQCLVDDLAWDQILRLMQQKDTVLRMPFGKYAGKPLSEVPKDYVAWLQSSGAFDKPENSALRDALMSMR